MASPFSANDFVGVRVKITLKQPDARVLEGTINDVTSAEGVSSLNLGEVVLLDTNTQFPSWIVSGTHIQDIELVNKKPKPNVISQHLPPGQDPAIVSFTRAKKPSSNVISAGKRHLDEFENHSQIISYTSTSVNNKPFNNSKEPVEIEGVAISPTPQPSQPTGPSISQLLDRVGDMKDEQQLRTLHKEIGALLDHQDVKTASPKAKGKAVSRQKNKAGYKGKGWRDTPILQEVNQEEFIPVVGSAKQKQRRKKKIFKEDVTGWATEDATDIQTMGAFDFEGSLAKFDKKKVFDELRKEDLVPQEDRLVSHNKVTRPGTFGGTKLHPTEMVLDGPSRASPGISRKGSHRTLAVEASSDTESALLNVSKKVVAVTHPKVSRTNTTVSHPVGQRKKSTIATSIASQDTIPTFTPTSSSPKMILSSGLNKTEDVQLLYQDRTTACPVVTPGGISALEKIANTLYNLSPDVSNENAGRTLAEIIISELRLPKNVRVTAQENLTTMIFVGNHRSGARALAAARHLRARGIVCVCCVLGLDRPGYSLDAEVERQLSMIRTPDTVVANWREVQKYLVHKEESGQHTELWIDAMLATGHGYDTLIPDEQNAVREIVSWINRRPNALGQRLVFSVDVPCGINASTGELIHVDDGIPLQLRSTNIISMGAPSTGLLNAMQTAWAYSETENEINKSYIPHPTILAVKLSVVDIGINEAWTTYGESLGLDRGSVVSFGIQWYIRLHVERTTNHGYDQEDDGEDDDDNEDNAE